MKLTFALGGYAIVFAIRNRRTLGELALSANLIFKLNHLGIIVDSLHSVFLFSFPLFCSYKLNLLQLCYEQLILRLCLEEGFFKISIFERGTSFVEEVSNR